jgi:hypothetical protein
MDFPEQFANLFWIGDAGKVLTFARWKCSAQVGSGIALGSGSRDGVAEDQTT